MSRNSSCDVKDLVVRTAVKEKKTSLKEGHNEGKGREGKENNKCKENEADHPQQAYVERKTFTTEAYSDSLDVNVHLVLTREQDPQTSSSWWSAKEG